MPNDIPNPKRAWRLPSIAPVELDKTDLRIISILQQNCRIKMSVIARHLRCSKAGVHYRIRRLEEKGVIRGYKTHINLFPQHYLYHLFFVAYQGDESLTDFMNVLHARDDVILLMSIFGEKNLMIGCAHANEMEFKRFREWLKPFCKKEKEEFSQGVAFTNMQLDYSALYENISALGVHKDSSFLHSFVSKKILKVDLKPDDFVLLRLLQQNAQLSLTELSEKTAKNKSVIRKRIDELIRCGIISKFSASVTPYAFPGMLFTVLRIHSKNKEKIPALKRRILEMKNGNGVVELLGRWALVAFLHFHNAEALTTFRENLQTLFPEAGAFQVDIIHEQAKLEWPTPLLSHALLK